MSEDSEQGWPFIASIIYVSAWSVSFYGQVWENWKCKSVEGFSMDFLVMNFIGYIFYGFYCTLGYFEHALGAGTVVLGDLIFVYHAFFCTCIWAVQSCIYPRGKNRLSTFATFMLIGLWIFIYIMVIFTYLIPQTQFFNPVSCLGYSNLSISFVKYAPAAYWNYKRKSTHGWSVFNIIFDLVGGIFSFASGTESVSNGLNLTKLLLAILTIFFDFIFLFQHYCLYRNSKDSVKIQNEQTKQKLIL